jgi:hypothetical protein
MDYSPGMKVWVDYRADGQWDYGGAWGTFDADGNPNEATTYLNPFTTGAMIGKLGSTVFLLGKEKLNYVPPGSGLLEIRINDGDVSMDGTVTRPEYVEDNKGTMAVRVILTK